MAETMEKLYLTGFVLILVGSSSLVNVQAGRKLTGLEWNVWFERLFQHGKYVLDGPVMMNILMRLAEGSSQAINADRQDMVGFWLDANVGDHKHCSRDYMAELESEHKKLLDSGYRREDVYTRTKKRVLANCDARLLRGVSYIKTLNEDEKQSVFKIGSLWQRTQESDNDIEKWNLGNYIGSLVGPAARKDQEGFVNAWNKGICTRLLAELDDRDMEIEEFLATFDYWTRKERDPLTNKWVTGIEACKHLAPDKGLSAMWQYVQEL